MEKNFKIVFLINAFLCCIMVRQASSAEKTDAIATIHPIAEFVEKVGGKYVDVSVMVSRGNDPHTYEPVPSQLKKVSEADLYFKLGSGIEFETTWMGKLASLNGEMTIVDTSRGVELVDTRDADTKGAGHRHAGKDPHIWLSPKNAVIMVRNIRDALIAKDPAREKYYSDNAEEYTKELFELDKDIKNRLAGKKNRLFMVFHPSWGYFARDYGLEEIAIEAEGKEPTISGLKRVVDKAKQADVKVIFTSPQFSQKSAEVIAKEIKAKVASIDPFGEEYIENIRDVAKILAEELK